MQCIWAQFACFKVLWYAYVQKQTKQMNERESQTPAMAVKIKLRKKVFSLFDSNCHGRCLCSSLSFVLMLLYFLSKTKARLRSSFEPADCWMFWVLTSRRAGWLGAVAAGSIPAACHVLLSSPSSSLCLLCFKRNESRNIKNSYDCCNLKAVLVGMV